ncbi:MAG: hypothetical protein V4537_02580 [Pseudomonadota bacterium]
MMRVRIILAATAALLAGCAHRAAPVAVVPPPQPVAAAPVPRPTPPGGASTSFTPPALLADGTYDTPNRALTPAATAWHLRAALNVAALRCNDEALIANYNGFVRTHGKALTAAHDRAMTEAGSQAAFDGAMTRLYNYFALPPVQASFCTAAATIADEAARTPASEFGRFVTLGLPVLDGPFTNFFREYGQYRVELARWQVGTPAPRLSYDTAVLLAEGPPRRYASAVAVAAR